MYYKIKLLVILCCLSSGSILAQNIKLIMSPKPSPYLSDWQSQTETVKLIISNSSAKEIEVKIKTELFDGKGALIANTDDTKMPVLTISPTSTTTYNPEDIIPSSAVIYYGNLEKTAITTGRIPDDNYRLCVTLIDPKSGKPVGTSGTVCNVFTIVAYQAPTLISPTNKEVIKGAAIKGIVFRWSPVIPSPKTIVTYRLQVWEVLQGQNSMTALRSNQPIVEKDLKGILQCQWPVDFALPDTGKTYVWTVTPFDDQERKMVDGLGFSEPFEMRACCWPPPLEAPPNDEDEISLISPGNGEEISKDVTFSWKDLGKTPKDGYTLRIVELKEGQSPDEAIANNSAVFEQKGIMSKSFKLGDSVGKLKDGGKYVWAVRSNKVFSEPFSFFSHRDVDPKGRPSSSIILISPDEKLEQSNTRPTFKWETEKVTEETTFTIIVREEGFKATIQEDAGKMKDRKILFERSGIQGNTFDYPKEIQALDTTKVYSWEVIAFNMKKELIGTSQLRMIIIVGSGWPMCLLLNCPPDQNICVGANCTLPVPVALVMGSCNPANMSYRIDNVGGWIALAANQTVISPCPALTVGQHIITFRLNCNCGQTRLCNYNLNVYPSLSAQVLDYPNGNTITELCWGEDATLNMTGLPTSCQVTWTYSINGGGSWNTVPGGGIGNMYNTNQINWFTCTGNFIYVLFRGAVNPGCLGLPSGWPSNCSNVITKTLKVWCKPQAGNLTALPANQCAPPYLPIQLNLGGPIIGNLTWSSSGGAFTPLSPTISNPTITFSVAGTYNVTVVVANGTCPTISRTIQIIVENPPSATLSSNDVDNTVCWGDDVQLSLSGITPPGATIQWQYQINCSGPWIYTPSGVIGTVQNTNELFGPSFPGIFPPTTAPCIPNKICWRAIITSPTGICGPITVGPLTIDVIVPPTAPIISPSSPIVKCFGQPVTLTSSSPICGTAPITYQWFRNGLPVATGSPTQVIDPGNYFVVVSNKNNCATAQSTNTVTVRDCKLIASITGPCTCDSTSTSSITLTVNTSSALDPPGPPPVPACGGPYTYLWSNGATTQTINVPCPSQPLLIQ
jgi:hypothetical protein